MKITNELKHELRDAILTRGTINSILREDLDLARAALGSDPSDFEIRTYIRTLFAYIEGTLFGYAQFALLWHRHHPCLTEAEVLLLDEQSPEVGDDGKVRLRSKFIDTCARLRFINRVLHKAFELDDTALFDFGDSAGWQAIKDATRIRNLITHPKSVEALLNEHEDGSTPKLVTVERAVQWFNRENLKFWTAVSSVLATTVIAETEQ